MPPSEPTKAYKEVRFAVYQVQHKGCLFREIVIHSRFDDVNTMLHSQLTAEVSLESTFDVFNKLQKNFIYSVSEYFRFLCR
jgi:hypothetical protein